MKKLIWLGSSRSRIQDFPALAQDLAGHQLLRIQHGGIPTDWRPMTDVGKGVNMTISKRVEKKPKSKVRSKPGRQDEHMVYESCGNLFQDMGKSDEEADNLMIRSMLMIEIEQAIAAMGCTKVHAAKVLGVSAPRINELVSGRIDLFTIDTLIKHLNKLGKRVIITVQDSAVA